MIVNEHIEDYINSLGRDLPDELAELEEWAIEQGVPIIRRPMQELLRFLITERRPMRVLEVGTAIGFSTLFMNEFLPAGSEIITIEKVEMRLVHARKNLAGHDNITLLEGDAVELLCRLAQDEKYAGNFDFVFLDAAKGQYMVFLKSIEALMKPGAMLVTDNVLLEGTIAESKFSAPRRDRTIHIRMREYLYELTHRPEFDTVVLPVGDGVALTLFNQ